MKEPAWLLAFCQLGHKTVTEQRLRLQSVTGAKDPGNDHKADGEENERHRDANSDVHIGNLIEAPAEPADQIDDRIEQSDLLPNFRARQGKARQG